MTAADQTAQSLHLDVLRARSAGTEDRTIADRVAERIRRLRQAHGWSVRQLADECARFGAAQLTFASLTNIERGQAEPGTGGRPRAADSVVRRRRDISIDELFALARVFGVHVEELTATDVECATCHSKPPSGFRCLTCGRADSESADLSPTWRNR